MDLKTILSLFAGIDDKDFALAEGLFTPKHYKKGESMNVQHYRSGDLFFIVKGFIRVYYIDPLTGKQINLFFFREHQFMFSFLIFNESTPRNYYIETLEDCEGMQISRKDLLSLYNKSHSWERFGRILAENYYRGSNARTESFIFKTPEERYLDLIKSFPEIFQRTSLNNIASYLGIESQSLSRIRRRLAKNKSK